MAQKKRLEISCSSADQNRSFCIYWSLIKASKRHYKSNSIQFKQEGRLLYPVGLIFRCFFFSFIAMIWPHSYSLLVQSYRSIIYLTRTFHRITRLRRIIRLQCEYGQQKVYKRVSFLSKMVYQRVQRLVTARGEASPYNTVLSSLPGYYNLESAKKRAHRLRFHFCCSRSYIIQNVNLLLFLKKKKKLPQNTVARHLCQRQLHFRAITKL